MADINSYDVGATVRLVATFTDLSGNFVDPSSVTCKIKDPTGLVTTYSGLVKDSTGHYHYDISVAASGYYYYRFIGTGANPGSARSGFYVHASDF